MYQKKIMFLIIICCIFNLFAKTSDDLNQIEIGSEPDYPPYCMINDEGYAEGFSIDLFAAAAKAVNINYEIKIDYWHVIKKDLASGALDALPLVGKNPEREPYYDFTFPYISLHGAAFVKKGDKRITTREDIYGHSLAVMTGDNAEEFVYRVNLTERDKIISTDTYEEAFNLLAAGKCDLVVTQRVMGLMLLDRKKIKNVTALDFSFDDFRQDFCFAVQEGNKDLLEKLNEGLAIVISDGTFDKIHQKWFSPVIYQSLSLWQRFKMVVYLVVPIIFLIFIIILIITRAEVKRKTQALVKEMDKRQQATEELVASEKRFRSYIYNAPTGIFVTDDRGYYIDVNKAACDITGYSRDELIGMHLLELIDDEFKIEAQEYFEDVIKKGQMSIELAFRRKNGDKRYWRIDASELTADTYLGFTVDITQSKLSDMEFKKNKDQLQFLFDNMNSAFAFHRMIYDENGAPADYIYIEVNQAFENMLNIKKEKLIGKRVSEILPGTKSDPAGWIDIYGDVAKTGNAVKFENYSQDVGKWFSISAYSPMKGYFATIFEDITARKETAEELNQYKNHLEELVKDRTRELVESNKELERFNKLFVGREFRIKELREKINELNRKLDDKK